MTLTLTPAEEANEGLEEAVGAAEVARGREAQLLEAGQPEPQAFATLVAVDGRRVRLARDNGAVIISIEGRQPVVLDRFQAVAFVAAAAALGDAP